MKAIFTFMLLACLLASNAQTTQTFITSGSFTVPAGVTSIFVEAWGSGGSGGGAKGTTSFRAMGGAGGGGAYNSGVIVVNPGDVITYTVAPQTAASVSAPVDGTPSSFSSITANGGKGGVAVTASTAHIGGAGGVGGTGQFNGGNGGSSVGFAGSTNGTSGGAGGGGGTTAAGSDGGAWSTTGGQLNGGAGGVLDGGAGAKGQGSSGNAGLIGTAPGGGGSGAYAAASTNQRNGGAGARGQIRITYPVTFITKAGATTWNTAASWIAGVVPPNGATVRIDNDIILDIPASIANLNLNGGKVTLGSNNLITNIITGGSASSFVITDASGSLKINNIGSTATLFPVGANATTYTPATLTNTGTVDNFSVRTEQNLPSCLSALSTNSVNVLWDITEDIPTGSDVALSLDYGASTTGGTYSNLAAKIAHCNGATSDYNNGSVSGTVATGTGFTNFSPFGITSDVTILPITLKSFTAVKNTNNVLVKWATSQESNIKNYIVEKSTNGVVYNSIATILANNATESNYQFTDVNVSKGSSLYRLKINGNDGKVSYSSVARISSTDNNSTITVYPTISNSKITADFYAEKTSTVNVIIIDAVGKIIKQQNVITNSGTNNLPIAINTLANGVYRLRIVGENINYIASFIKN